MTRAVPPPTILLTGASGQIGQELARSLPTLGRVVACTRAELPLERSDRIRDVVRALRPHAIVNAGAYTAVDLAEREPELAGAVNGVAPGVLAEEAARCGAVLVHFSTDYVFDGTKREPYTEDDVTNPLGVYGRTKLEGERSVAAAGAAHVTFRTAWVYGSHGRNFLRTVLALAKERTELRVVCDQVGAPTWSRALAQGVTSVLARARNEGGFDIPYSAWGVHHLAATGEVSWFGFAEAILARVPARSEYACRSVVAITSAEYPTPARRPAYSVLDSGRAAATFGVRLPHWETQLEMCLDTMRVTTSPLLVHGT